MTGRFPSSQPMRAPPLQKPSNSKSPPRPTKFAPDFSVTPSSEFFASQIQVQLNAEDVFNVYLNATKRKSSAESDPPNKSAKFAVLGLDADPNASLVIIFLHGAGFSALSWAPLVKCLGESLFNAHFVAMDLRGHGMTRTQSEDNFNFDLLSTDVCDVYEALVQFGHLPAGEDNNTKLFLVGHSMGGALAAYIGANCQQRLPNLGATCIIDVVEGSAIDALSGMKNVLRSRPKSFKSEQQAVEWSVRSGYIKRRDSAKVSMIGQIIPLSSPLAANQASEAENCDAGIKGSLDALQEVDDDDCEQVYDEKNEPSPTVKDSIASPAKQHNTPTQTKPVAGLNGTSPESDVNYPRCVLVDPDNPIGLNKTSEDSESFTWRIDLFKTEKFWQSWFTGLTSNYLAFPGPKLLILAGVDRLDKDLTVAQMQGKFQMLVLPKAGHAIQEDVPDKVADALATFVQRNKLAPTNDSTFSRTTAGC